MPISELLKSIYRNVNLGIDGKLSLVCEIYEPDTLPGVDGFDPADALACFSGASVPDWAGYRGKTYHRLVKKWGPIDRSGGTEFNSVNLGFANDGEKFMASLILSQPLGTFEGYHLVIRIISRDQSVTLQDSDVRFCGKIDKPSDITREDFPLSAKEHIGTIDVVIPRRKFSYDDLEGRDPADPLFEGYRFLPTSGELTFKVRERRTDILGLFGLKKTVTKTLQYSSHSALDAGRAVPLVFGRCQMLGIHIGYADVGNSIPMLTAWADGGRYGIWKYENLRKVSPGFTPLVTLDAAPTYRYGTAGGTGTQFPVLVPSAADKIGNGYYSYTAWTYTFVNGSELDQDDAAPDLASIIFGCIIPLPDATGAFTTTGFSDNPAYIARFILTDPFLMNIDPAFIDDAVCVETGKWCDQYIEDSNQTDTVQLPDSQIGIAGTSYHLYKSSSSINARHFKYLLGLDENPYIEEAEYQFFPQVAPTEPPFEPPEPLPIPNPLTPRFALRRRWTANVPITEPQKAIDFLNNVLFPGTALYSTQGANGKIQIRVKKPVDFALVRGSTVAGIVEIPVDSVLPWVNSLDGKIYIGEDGGSINSEIRKPTGWRYTTAGNSITLAKTGNVTLSGATFSGGNNTTTPASATLTFTGGGLISVTIDGITLTHVAFGIDTTSTLAGWFAAAINAHPTLGRYIKATWNTSTPTIVSLTSKIGFIQFATPLQKTHAAAEKVMRIKASFSTGAAAVADLQRSNVIDNSFRWPGGSRQSSYNVVELSYRDSSQDWRYTTLRVKSDPHIAQIKKRVVKEVNGSCIDNQNQASRRANQIIAELRDCDFFVQHASDGEALLVEEGDVICINTDDFVNLPIRVEDLRLSPDLAVSFVGRRYLNSIFSDAAEERIVPIPTLLTYMNHPPPVATSLTLTEVGAYGPDGMWHARLRGVFNFGAYAGPQQARVKVDRAGGTSYRDTNNLIRPDANNQGTFEIDVAAGLHSVQIITENKYGDKASSGHLTGSKNIVGTAPTPAAPTGGLMFYDPIAGEIRGSFTLSSSPDVAEYEVYSVVGAVETYLQTVYSSQFTLQPPTNWSGALTYKVYSRNNSRTRSATGLTMPSISPPAPPTIGNFWNKDKGLGRETVYSFTVSSEQTGVVYEVYKTVTGATQVYPIPPPLPEISYEPANTRYTGGTPSTLIYRGPEKQFILNQDNPLNTSNPYVRAVDRFGNVGQWTRGDDFFQFNDYVTTGNEVTAPTIKVDTAASRNGLIMVRLTTSNAIGSVSTTRVQVRQQGGAWPSSGAEGDFEEEGLNRTMPITWLRGGIVEVRAMFTGSPDSSWSSTVTHKIFDDIQVLAFSSAGGISSTIIPAQSTVWESLTIPGVNQGDVVSASATYKFASGILYGGAAVENDGGLVSLKFGNITSGDLSATIQDWHVHVTKKRPTNPELLRDLVAHWRMNEASGTRYDAHGSSHLTDNNTVTTATGKIGSAALFTAANSEYLSCTSNSSLQMGDIDFTIIAWVYLTSKGAHRMLVSKMDNAARDEFLIYYRSTADRFAFEVRRDTGAYLDVNADALGSPAINTWYQIVVWHIVAARTINIQVNNGGVNSLATGGPLAAASTSPFMLGGWGYGGSYHDGRIDSVSVYKRLLGTGEPGLLYNSGNALAYPF
ncbi:MAG TPA: LamG domain-containing protein [Pyrinomonadaceae bacterium]|nr:LamG domain-containing protein [Pyrinomonadaceae bacterium]